MPNQSPATHTPESLTNVSKELVVVATEIQRLAQMLEEFDFDSLVVKAGTGELRRGMERIRTFGKYVNDSLYNARKDRGDFGCEETKKPAKKAVKRKGQQ